MFTKKDIEYRSIFLVNCFDEKHLKLRSGELLLQDAEGKTLTKFPFQKILALFVVGNATITTPLIDKCRKYGVFLSVMKTNLRPVFTFGNNAEANFLLREKQYAFNPEDISVAKHLINVKIRNQQRLLRNTRKADTLTQEALSTAETALHLLHAISSYKELMGVEGWVAKDFFKAYFQEFNWVKREPRAKIDEINVMLDIGYSMLFNFLESYSRLFGFDLYVGVYHRLWFKRKSLLCDLIEPFRYIVDSTVRKNLNLKKFKFSDFKRQKQEMYLKHERAGEYYKTFMAEIIEHKKEIFSFFQGYYRYFMNLDKNPPFPSLKI